MKDWNIENCGLKCKNFKYVAKSGNYFDVKNDLEQFTRKLQVREAVWNTESHGKSLVRKKSTKPVSSKYEELQTIVRKIEMLEPSVISIEDNMSTDEQNALNELKSNKNIIIKPADKGSSVVIMNAEFYRDKLVYG